METSAIQGLRLALLWSCSPPFWSTTWGKTFFSWNKFISNLLGKPRSRVVLGLLDLKSESPWSDSNRPSVVSSSTCPQGLHDCVMQIANWSASHQLGISTSSCFCWNICRCFLNQCPQLGQVCKILGLNWSHLWHLFPFLLLKRYCFHKRWVPKFNGRWLVIFFHNSLIGLVNFNAVYSFIGSQRSRWMMKGVEEKKFNIGGAAYL